MSLPPWTPQALAFHWGDAYVFSYTRDRWVALRRDKRYFIVADTLDELEAAIRIDYRSDPVPRVCDPPGAGDYPGRPEEDRDERTGDQGEHNAGLDPDTAMVLSELRQLFPRWDVTYSAELQTWMAKSRSGSFSEHSIALIWVALARMERRKEERRTDGE